MPTVDPDTGPPLTGPRFFPVEADTANELGEHSKSLHVNFHSPDNPEIVEFVHEFSYYNYAPDGILTDPRLMRHQRKDRPVRTFTADHRRSWVRSAANARRRALDLAGGIGTLGDPEDTDAFSQPKQGVNDDRRRPLVWEEDFCLIYVEPEDGMASYGRSPVPVDCKFLARSVAIMHFRSDWHKYHHFGQVPTFKAVGRMHAAPAVATPAPVTSGPAPPGGTYCSSHEALSQGIITPQQHNHMQVFLDWIAARDKVRLPDVTDMDGSPDSETEAEACAAAKMHGGPVQMWLIDTGCGHDLVARKELKALKRLIRQANIPLNFSTANGEVPANECADLLVKELNEAVEPYVLEDPCGPLSRDEVHETRVQLHMAGW